MQTRQIKGIVLSDIDAGLEWLDGEDMVFGIYAAMDGLADDTSEKMREAAAS